MKKIGLSFNKISSFLVITASVITPMVSSAELTVSTNPTVVTSGDQMLTATVSPDIVIKKEEVKTLPKTSSSILFSNMTNIAKDAESSSLADVCSVINTKGASLSSVDKSQLAWKNDSYATLAQGALPKAMSANLVSFEKVKGLLASANNVFDTISPVASSSNDVIYKINQYKAISRSSLISAIYNIKFGNNTEDTNKLVALSGKSLNCILSEKINGPEDGLVQKFNEELASFGLILPINTKDDIDGTDKKDDTLGLIINAKDINREVPPEVVLSNSVVDAGGLEKFVKYLMSSDNKIINVIINDENMKISYSERAKLLGFIPMNLIRHRIVTSTGDVSTKLPWYSFLAKKGQRANDNEVVASLANNGLVLEKNQDGLFDEDKILEANKSFSLKARILDSVMSVLKEKSTPVVVIETDTEVENTSVETE